MFDRIGRKIMSYAQFLSIMGIIASCAYGIVLVLHGSIGLGILYACVGSLAFWISSFTLYGFGEMIENTQEIKELLATKNDKEVSDKAEQKAEQPIQPQNFTEERKKEILSNGGWTCECGRVNFYFITKCDCGRKKR